MKKFLMLFVIATTLGASAEVMVGNQNGGVQLGRNGIRVENYWGSSVSIGRGGLGMTVERPRVLRIEEGKDGYTTVVTDRGTFRVKSEVVREYYGLSERR